MPVLFHFVMDWMIAHHAWLVVLLRWGGLSVGVIMIYVAWSQGTWWLLGALVFMISLWCVIWQTVSRKPGWGQQIKKIPLRLSEQIIRMIDDHGIKKAWLCCWYYLKHRLRAWCVRVRQQRDGYIVLSAESADVSAWLKCSGCRELKTTAYDSTSTKDKLAMNAIWQTERADFYSFALPPSESKATSARYVQSFKQWQRTHPVTAVVIMCPIVWLLSEHNQDAQVFCTRAVGVCAWLYQALGHSVPVYLVLSQCDRIPGYLDTAEAMMRHQKHAFFGVRFSFDQDARASQTMASFEKAYDRIIGACLTHHLSRPPIAEAPMRCAHEQWLFPMQLQCLRQPLKSLLQHVYCQQETITGVRLRGVFFLPGQSGGARTDFLQRLNAKQYQLTFPKPLPALPPKRTHLAQQGLRALIIDEAPLLGHHHSVRRQKRWQCTLIIIMVLLMGTLTAHLWSRYRRIVSTITTYQRQRRMMDQPGALLSNVLKVEASIAPLRHWSQWIHLVRTQNTGFSSWLLGVKQVAMPFVRTQHQWLSQVFLTSIMVQLEQDLMHPTPSSILRYAQLKAYLAFDISQGVDPHALIIPLFDDWKHLGQQPGSLGAQLRDDLQKAIAQPMLTQALNVDLIDKTLATLPEQPLRDRAYALFMLWVRSMALPSFPLPHVIAQMGSVFALQAMPSLSLALTQKRYRRLLDANAGWIAGEVAMPLPLLTLKRLGDPHAWQPSLVSALRHDAITGFYEYWMNLSQHIHVLHSDTLEKSVALLKQVMPYDSPMQALLRLIVSNTMAPDDTRWQAVSQFKPLVSYVNQHNKPYSWQHTLLALRPVMLMLTHRLTLQQANQGVQLMPAHFSSAQQSIIQVLMDQINHAPWPLKRWLHELVDPLWHQLVSQMVEALNHRWQQRVYALYQQHVSGHFPIDMAAEDDLSLYWFNRFFAPAGLISQFNQQQLQPLLPQLRWFLGDNRVNRIMKQSSITTTLTRLHAIQHAFFASSKTQAALQFDVQPLSLKANSQRMSLTYAGKTMVYAHGPLIGSIIHWPFLHQRAQASIRFTDFNDHTDTIAFHGVWSWLQLFAHAQLSSQPIAGQYRLHFQVADQAGSWLVSHVSDRHRLSLDAIKNMMIPQQLISLTAIGEKYDATSNK